MFPHNYNSSSHEIFTETNAFVQNSKRDVVVLDESSLIEARKGERPEYARYCDIEFINSSMMAAPTSHPKATAADDFLTVLPHQSDCVVILGELSFAKGGEACQSVAPETTIKNPTNHLLTYDNNDIDKIINHDNAEHNHHKYRKQNTSGSLYQQLSSSADNSKSTCKLLSDNKDSFSDLSIRVLELSVRMDDDDDDDDDDDGDTRPSVGTSSLVRILKSEHTQRQLVCLANIVNNYSLLRYRLCQGENNNNIKVNIKNLSNNNDNDDNNNDNINNYYYKFNNNNNFNAKSVILLSSTKYGDIINIIVTNNGFAGVDAVEIPVYFIENYYKLIINILTMIFNNNNIIINNNDKILLKFINFNNNEEKIIEDLNASLSSITLIVSNNEIIKFTDHTLQLFIDNLTQVRVLSPIIISQYFLWHVTVSKLTQRICVPLLINNKNNKAYDNDNKINNKMNNKNIKIKNIMYTTNGNGEEDEEEKKKMEEEKYDVDNNLIMMIIISKNNNNNNNNNTDVYIKDIVNNVAVCYKYSKIIMTTNILMLESQNKMIGIHGTEATIYTVGALLFQDNNKSNKHLNNNDNNNNNNDNEYQVSTKIGIESNYYYDNIMSLCKLTQSDKLSDKFKMSHDARQNGDDYYYDDNDNDIIKKKYVKLVINIPILTTCEPTMTLISQSATVTSQTTSVPVSQDVSQDIEKNNNVNNITVTMILTSDNNNINNNNCNYNDNNATNNIINEQFKTNINDNNTEKLIETNQDDNDDDNDDEDNAWVKSRKWARLIAYIRTLIFDYQEAYKYNNEYKCENHRNKLKKALPNLFGSDYYTQYQNKSSTIFDSINDYKKRWGIPSILSLVGGGEGSLNSSGSTNWGTAPATTPNNNNNANQSGWGSTPGNAPPPATGNWGINNVNRPVTGNQNQNPIQGPPGNPTNPTGTVNKVTSPGQPTNQTVGGGVGVPPISQSSNSTQSNQNQNNSWSQGKSNNPIQGQNPSGQNNNGNNTGPPQPIVTNTNNNQVNNTVQGTTGQPGVVGGGTNQPSVPNVVGGSGGSVVGGGVGGGNGNGGASVVSSPTSSNPSTKQQLEQLNTMREALFSQDGWGCQYVNQDSNWDVPQSPEPPATKDGTPMWKPPVNNGTDLWEANLRNGGQPPPPQQAKTPWGHTPSTNIGGTWGEDDESADTSNMWGGPPTPGQQNPTQWPGTTNSQATSNWGDPRIDSRDPRDLRSVDPREIRDPRDHRMSMDPREHLRTMDPMTRDPRIADMRGDPRGISGRLNGASADAMWGQPPGPPQHHQMGGHQHPSGPPANKMINPSSMNQWGGQPPKDMMPGGKTSGWEEPSPPTQRRNVPNYDDGTSLWGNPAANQRSGGNGAGVGSGAGSVGGGGGGNGAGSAMPGNKVSHWKDLSTPNLGRGNMQCPPGMPHNRMPGQPGMKPDVGGPMWGHPGGGGGGPGRNGSWGEGPHETTSWDEPKTPTSWNEPPLNPANWSGPPVSKSKSAMGPGGSWGEPDMETTPSWAHPAKPALTKDVIWNSREFRYLCDLGYKKEDVETALRSREMNRDEAQELLSQIRSLDQWRRHDAPSNYDPNSQASMAAVYPKFSHVAQQISFPPASRTPQNPPSTQQLRMLVQQIQLAVQEGYLNQQILNQPLAPPTLILLNQLLQQIKVLQQLHQQHSVQGTLKGNSQTLLQISVQITKTKQQISNLQNQIAIQQATYMKQQQQQQHPAAQSQSSDYYKPVHDSMSALQNSFSDLGMNKEQPVSQQGSRLNQWKLPSLDKDLDIGGNEFSRAPGTTSKPLQAPGILPHAHGSPNINPLLGQGDGTWSTRLGDSGWPDAVNNDATDGKDWQPGSAAFTDLVPEFEPGKPWKMKSIEDDPSITPGSVVRSLSLAAIKDPDAIFSSSSKTSPPPQAQNVDTSIPSLSSNTTWTFNPPTTMPFSSSKNSWTDSAPPPTAVTSELWGAPMNKARQGPPPGLGNKGVTSGNANNGWTGLGGVSRSSNSWGLQSNIGGGGGGNGGNAGWPLSGTWLVLKNLTPQIDGSTLKTLCMQHGPVQDFRLYLNHGIAFTKYSSRDEASKAQGALNNCVLGNTTIFAESPADSEVHSTLQQLSHGGAQQQQGGGSSGSSWGLRQNNKAGPPPDTWGGSSSQLWGAQPVGNSLWNNSGLDTGEAQRTTPSLNSYLPGDLLGGESM